MPFGILIFLCLFVIFVFSIIVMLVLKNKSDRLSSFTPEQQKAIKFQNNALTVWAMVLVSGILLFPIIEKNSLVLASIYKNIFIFLGIGVAISIAISSIISKVSVLRKRRSREDFSQGKTAIEFGIMILVFLGLALLWWFIQR